MGQQGNRNDSRVRGNAHQLHEKFKNLSRDAASAGDRILAEYYMQHADHYFRVLNEMRPERPRDDQRRRDNAGDDMTDGDDGQDTDDGDIAMQPQGFGAHAAAGTFGVAQDARDLDRDSGEDMPERPPVAAEADLEQTDEANGNEAQPRARESGRDSARDAGRPRPRGRGRPRRTVEAEASEPVDA